MNSTYISLNNRIDANKFINIVQNFISKYGDVTDCILKLEIVKITREYNELIPKIEYKSNE